MRKSILAILLVSFYPKTLLSQDKGKATGEKKLSAAGLIKVSAEIAGKYYKQGNYLTALNQYAQLAGKDTANVEYRYRLGVCYLKLNGNKTRAIPHLEFAANQPKTEPQALYDLARAYHLANRFDDAIKYYMLYSKAIVSIKTDTLGNEPVTRAMREEKKRDAGRQIAMCNNGKNLVTEPVDVSFENAGAVVNSAFPDYYPWITANEEFLFFTSRRPENIGGKEADYDGFISSDIYMTTVKNGQFSKIQNLGRSINTIYDEQAAGISPDGSYVVIYVDWVKIYGDLMFTRRAGKLWKTPDPLNENINTPELESAGALSSDRDILYFSSNTPGGYGGTDIYMSKLLPDGTWGLRINMGPSVNTSFNEDFPNPYPDGRTLYFCSSGHNSMGGYDLFKSVFDTASQSWAKPENLGYPVNNADDNMNISFPVYWKMNNTYTDMIPVSESAYLSAWRPEGRGDLDIYRIIFNDVEHRYSVVKGLVYSLRAKEKGQFEQEPVPDDSITVYNAVSKKLYGIYKIRNGKYIMALQSGKYSVDINIPGYQPFNEILTVHDKVSFMELINKSFVLRK